MEGIEARAALAKLLMERVREDRYPSTQQMAILEEVLPSQLLPDYYEILLEKVANDRWPSPPMMRCLQRVARSMS